MSVSAARRARGLRIGVLGLALALLAPASGCNVVRQWFQRGPKVELSRASAERSQYRVDVSQARMVPLEKGEGELQITVESAFSEKVWVQVRIDSPGARRDCVTVRGIEAHFLAQVTCKQSSTVPEGDYLIELTVYSDIGTTKAIERSRRRVRLGAGGVGEILPTAGQDMP